MNISAEQRNRYKGNPERAWIRLRFVANDGSSTELELLTDTGSPCSVIVSRDNLQRLQTLEGAGMATNFGPLPGGWLQLAMPELGLDQLILGYASDSLVAAVQMDHPDFQGVAGLPLLRLVEYGGDADCLWLRSSRMQNLKS